MRITIKTGNRKKLNSGSIKLTLASCHKQILNQPQNQYSPSPVDPDPEPQVPNGIFGVIGDSNADGRSNTIPSIPSGRLYNFVSGSFTAVTTQSVANGGSSWGSIWQNFAVEYFNSTGRPVYLCNGASGGSNFYPDGDTNNWYSTGGTLRAAFISKMSAALAARGEDAPQGIFVNLGINDARSIHSASESYANFQTGVTSLFTWLTTDYPGVPIYVIIPGRAETPTYSYNDSNFYAVRQTIRNAAQSFTDVIVMANALTWVDGTTIGGSGNAYMADGLHYDQGMNDQLGVIANRIVQSTITNKWARGVVCARFSDYSGAFADALATRITNLVTSGDYFKMETTVLTVSPSQDERDCLIDITFLSNCVLFGAPTVNSDHCLSFNGSSQYMSAIYIPQWFNQSGAGQDNYIIGARLVSRTTASGVSASLVGRAVGTTQTRVIQTIVPSVAWYPSRNAAETWSGGDTSLQNAFYAVARNSGTGYLYKGSTQVDSAVSASAGVLNATLVTMAHEPGTGITQYLGGTLGYHLNAAFNLDLAYTLTQLEAIIAAR